jgi:multidrug efflux pump subunit AcrA (membrane-fusion protein)
MDAALKALNAKAAALSAQASALASATAGVTNPSSAQNQASVLSSTNSALQAAAAAAVGNAASRTGSGNVTQATLITDKANIEATRITLAQAQDQLSQATITSPIAGKVASIPFILGQQASATASAVIIGSGAIEVTVPVPLAKRPQVSTNQTATVTSSVGGTALTGTISRISLLPTSTGVSLAAVTAGGAAGAAAANSSTTSTTYATVITVPTGGDLLPEGSRVQASITTKTVDAKVVLPASAVTPTGSTSATVQVLDGSTVTVKRIVMGAVGDAYVEIVSGLTVGETVIIADTTIPIAAASIQTGRASQTAVQQQTGGFDPAQGGVPPGGGGVPTGGGAAPTR